ncbi:NAD(P)-binding domain-containing protein [Paraburkholderia sp. JHI869]|uniref:NADPH-dependent F420 reductase n=1 Tax=Paraburkholderia sp. JHI869 TaxID=3112959 RepID=UPI0031799E41
MKITVIGTGNMGAAFVKQLTAAGHEVRVTGRDLAKAQALASQNPGAEAVVAAVSAIDSTVVILATGYNDAVAALRSVGDVSGKTVIDITNPLTADYMGLTIGHQSSAAEEIARAVPGADVVKAFNTLFAQVLADGPAFANGQRGAVFYAGDSALAKTTVKSIIDSLGFEAVDAGGLKNARYLEPLAGLNIYFGYGASRGTAIAPVWIAK